MDQLNELGFYTLAGHSDSPRDLVGEVRDAERIGLGSAFVSERFNLKEAATLSGAAGAVSETLGIATAATNPNTRHPMVTATFATTMHRLTGGRFALGLGRGFDPLFQAMGLQPVTSAQLEDIAGILRRLWKGEMILGHDGPAGTYPYLHQDADFDEDIPLLLVALGERTLELAGRVMDGVVLHTFFTDEALANSVAAVRRGAESAGRDPDAVRIWSVLATVGDHIDEELRLKKTVGRLATYLQGYGDLLVRVNGLGSRGARALPRGPVRAGLPRRLRRQGDDRRARAARDAAAGRVDRARRDGHARAVHRDGPAPVRPRRQRRDPARRDARRARADPPRLPRRAPGAVHRRAGQPRTAARVNPVVDDVAELTPAGSPARSRRGATTHRSRRWRPSASARARSAPATGSRSRTSRRPASTRPATTNPAPRRWSRRWPVVTRRRAERVKEGFAKEVGFYTELAGSVDVRIPKCWYGAITDDKTSFVLLLDDLAPARQGVQADGCTAAQAADCVTNLAGLHAPRWNDEALLEIDFLTPMDPAIARSSVTRLRAATEPFVARYADELSAADVATLWEVADALTQWLTTRPRRSRSCTATTASTTSCSRRSATAPSRVDWQTVGVGPPARDIAYFLGNSLERADRQAHEEILVGRYHAALHERGVRDYDLATCFDDYRLGQLQGPMITVLGCMYATAERSERSDGMFLAMITRSCAAIRDLRSLDLL